MKYILTAVLLMSLSNAVIGAEHNHASGIVESCLNDGFGDLVFSEKEITEAGETYYTAKGSISCQVSGLQMMASRKAKLTGGNCVLTQVTEDSVEMKYSFDYKIHSSVDLANEQSIFDDANDCFIESLR